MAESKPRVVRHAAAVLIGNELLTGKTQELNLLPLARALRALGIPLTRAVTVGDEPRLIAQEIGKLRAEFDVIFTSGGVGPTHDDCTVEGVALAFGVSVVRDPRLEQLLRGVYGERCGEQHLAMARVPDGSELLGAASVRWPTVVKENVWLLPGIPELFRMKLAALRSHLVGRSPVWSREVLLRAEETELKNAIDSVVLAHPQVEVGSYPKWFDDRYRTRVTFDAPSEPLVESARQDFLGRVPASQVVFLDELADGNR